MFSEVKIRQDIREKQKLHKTHKLKFTQQRNDFDFVFNDDKGHLTLRLYLRHENYNETWKKGIRFY